MRHRKKGGAELRQRKEHGGRDDSHRDGREEKVTVKKKRCWGGLWRKVGGKESGKVRTRMRTEGKRKKSKDEMKMER